MSGGGEYNPPDDRITGLESYFVWDGTEIPITRYRRKSIRSKKDTTDSRDWFDDDYGGAVQPTAVVTAIRTEIAAEGRYRFSATPNLDQVIQTSQIQVEVTLGRTAGNLSGTGTFDISEYEEDGPYDDVMTWTAVFTSNGPFTAD